MTLPTFERLVPKGVRMRILSGDNLYDEPEWWNGRLLIWEPPARGGAYAIGVDCGEGVNADRSVASVIKIGGRGQPDRQVAEFASNYHGPAAMAPLVAALGKFYADEEGYEAIVTAEANALGQIVLQDLQLIHDYSNLYVRRAYDRYENIWINKLGFHTNQQTRPALIARMRHAVWEGQLVPVAEELLQEMEDFEGDWNLAKARAKSGQHDDRVMAFALAYWGAHDDEFAAGEDPVAEHSRLTAAADLQHRQEAKDQRKADFQNTAITYEEMLLRADEEIFDQ